MRKFETIYAYARKLSIGKLGGSRLIFQREVNVYGVEFQRELYVTFRTEVLLEFNLDTDRNPWVFNQNLLKTRENGKVTTKQLCHTLFVQMEAIYEVIK